MHVEIIKPEQVYREQSIAVIRDVYCLADILFSKRTLIGTRV